MTTAGELLKSGKLKALAVTTARTYCHASPATGVYVAVALCVPVALAQGPDAELDTCHW